MKFCSISALFVLQCAASDESLLSEALESPHFKPAVKLLAKDPSRMRLTR
jgi:hypothetical protein